MKFFRRLFNIPDTERRWYSVIAWWEVRRIAYNIIVGIVGFICLMAFLLLDELPPKPTFEEADWEPLSVIIGAIVANICYTGGWVAELVARALWRERARSFGPIAFSLGLIFSLCVCLLPVAANLFSWGHRAVKHHNERKTSNPSLQRSPTRADARVGDR